MSVLFINACMRKESRTKILADALLSELRGEVVEINLNKEEVLPLDEGRLNSRNSLIAKKDFNHPIFRYAKMFAEAEQIVIAAPFWDLSFPAALKCFIEAINISGITFKYSSSGEIIGLCKARRLIYVTTAGGIIPENNYGFGYIESLCKNLYGIQDVVLIKAEKLDILGTDIKETIENTKQNISVFLKTNK